MCTTKRIVTGDNVRAFVYVYGLFRENSLLPKNDVFTYIGHPVSTGPSFFNKNTFSQTYS